MLLSIGWALAPTVGFSDPLTRQQLLDMKSAGIGEQLIIQQAETTGIAFPVDADAMIALRKAGFSDSLLAALMKTSTSSSKSVADAPLDRITELYKARRYAEAADLLKGKTGTNSATDRERVILVLTLLKLEKSDQARNEYDSLKARYPNSPFLPQLASVLAAADDRRALLGRINVALEHLSTDELDKAITEARLSAAERQALLADAAVIGGDFSLAKTFIEHQEGLSYTEQGMFKDKEKEISAKQQAFDTALAEWTKKAIPSNPDNISSKGIEPYLSAVKQLYSIAPLNPAVEDSLFYAALITSNYADVETLGDRILGGKGNLRVPFTFYPVNGAFTMTYDVVIDSKQRRLRTEETAPRENKAKVCSFMCGGMGSLEPVSFNLEFAQIKRIEQNLNCENSSFGWLCWQKDSYMLKLSPTGLAPFTEGAEQLTHYYGDGITKKMAHDLGLYVQHVAGLQPSQLSLVDPGKADAKSTGLMRGVAAIGSIVGAPSSGTLLNLANQTDEATVAAQVNGAGLASRSEFKVSIADSLAVQDLEATLHL